MQLSDTLTATDISRIISSLREQQMRFIQLADEVCIQAPERAKELLKKAEFYEDTIRRFKDSI